jgi:hypothetical protein
VVRHSILIVCTIAHITFLGLMWHLMFFERKGHVLRAMIVEKRPLLHIMGPLRMAMSVLYCSVSVGAYFFLDMICMVLNECCFTLFL